MVNSPRIHVRFVLPLDDFKSRTALRLWAKNGSQLQVTLFRIAGRDQNTDSVLRLRTGTAMSFIEQSAVGLPGPARSSPGPPPGPPTPTQYTACDGDNVGHPGYTQAGTPVSQLLWNGYRSELRGITLVPNTVLVFEWGIGTLSGETSKCKLARARLNRADSEYGMVRPSRMTSSFYLGPG